MIVGGVQSVNVGAPHITCDLQVGAGTKSNASALLHDSARPPRAVTSDSCRLETMAHDATVVKLRAASSSAGED